MFITVHIFEQFGSFPLLQTVGFTLLNTMVAKQAKQERILLCFDKLVCDAVVTTRGLMTYANDKTERTMMT